MSSKQVQIVEVSLRDGLQNESWILPPKRRVEIARQLAFAGIKRIEAGSFVNSRWVPQMADSELVLGELLESQREGRIDPVVSFTALVPNQFGFDQALRVGLGEIAIFSAASETFSRKNTNCTIDEGFARFAPIVDTALRKNLKVRAYVSTCFACPFEGVIPVSKVVDISKRLYEMGCYEISIGDTIGFGTPTQVESLFSALIKEIPVSALAGHFHDTNGTALVNIYKAYEMGLRVFDSSLGGLGGCPYAPGSRGNVSTESVVYMFHGMGVDTGIDLKSLKMIHFLKP